MKYIFPNRILDGVMQEAVVVADLSNLNQHQSFAVGQKRAKAVQGEIIPKLSHLHFGLP